MKSFIALSALFCSSILLGSVGCATTTHWSEHDANQWYQAQPWPVGSNFIPSNAVNALEMWQADTFDAVTIDRELTYAETTGFTTVRVFLHDLAWQADPAGFVKRVDAFLALASKHHIRPLLVLFDSCWDPRPLAGPQPAPRAGVHNSRWVQSPGLSALMDPGQTPRLQNYVQGIVKAFAKDPRIFGWDVWNEPDNTNNGSYFDPAAKVDQVLLLLPQVFAWARSSDPVQPLTSGVWAGDWSDANKLSPMNKIQIENSDFISFHNYDVPAEFEKRVIALGQFHRPIVCTEYMARPLGSTLQTILPIAKKYHVGAMNWGFVAGKTQTYIPWDSWTKPYTEEPKLWFHDLYRTDGSAYLPEEITFLQHIR